MVGDGLREVGRPWITQGTLVHGEDLGFYSIRGFGAGKSDQHIVSCLPVLSHLGCILESPAELFNVLLPGSHLKNLIKMEWVWPEDEDFFFTPESV